MAEARTNVEGGAALDEASEAPADSVMLPSSAIPATKQGVWKALTGLLAAMRPHQWVKNLFVFFPLVFAKELLDTRRALAVLAGFFAYSLLASAVYITNDLLDVDGDREHPRKRLRPIASGRVPQGLARAGAATLAATA